MLVGYFLYCGTLLLLIVASSYFVVSIWAKSSGLIKCRSFRPSAGICFFDVRGRRRYLRRVSLSMGGGTRNRISRTL